MRIQILLVLVVASVVVNAGDDEEVSRQRRFFGFKRMYGHAKELGGHALNFAKEKMGITEMEARHKKMSEARLQYWLNHKELLAAKYKEDPVLQELERDLEGAEEVNEAADEVKHEIAAEQGEDEEVSRQRRFFGIEKAFGNLKRKLEKHVWTPVANKVKSELGITEMEARNRAVHEAKRDYFLALAAQEDKPVQQELENDLEGAEEVQTKLNTMWPQMKAADEVKDEIAAEQGDDEEVSAANEDAKEVEEVS